MHASAASWIGVNRKSRHVTEERRLDAWARAAAVAVAVTVLASSGLSQTIADIAPNYPGVEVRFPHVSRDGSTVVGQWFPAGPPAAGGFRWTASTGIVSLSQFSIANATNEDGSVVVGQSISSPAAAMYWSSSTGSEVLPLVWPDAAQTALAVSADGNTVVGQASHAFEVRGVIWRKGPSGWTVGLTGYFTFQGFSAFIATAVSDDGATVAGTANVIGLPLNVGVAALWSDPGGPFSIASQGNAKAISGDGLTLVGIYGTSTERAFRWSAADGFLDLGAGEGLGVSGDGNVVVGNAVVWVRGLGAAAPGAFAQSQGVDVSGWSGIYPWDVSRDGRVIVGDGVHRVWRMELPFPPGCASDYNHDTFVSGDDFDAFVYDFEFGLPSADVDHNAFVNGDDFDYFMDRFVAGC